MQCLISEKQTLEAHRLLVFCGELEKREISKKIAEMMAYAESRGISVAGNVISVTFSSRDSEKGQILRVGIYLPVNGRLDDRGDVMWQEKFLLSNAVKLEFEGTPEQLPEACQRVEKHIREKKLKVVTDAYRVIKKTDEQFNRIAMEIYIGVCENIL